MKMDVRFMKTNEDNLWSLNGGLKGEFWDPSIRSIKRHWMGQPANLKPNSITLAGSSWNLAYHLAC